MNKDDEFTRFKVADVDQEFARPVWSGMRTPEDWTKINMGKSTKRIGGYAFSSEKFGSDETEESYPLIKRSTINNDRPPQQHTIEEFDDKHLVKKGDILVSMDGHFRPMYWDYEYNAALNQRTCKVIPNESMVSRFLYYLLDPLLEYTQESTGATTVKSLSMKDFNYMNPSIPPLSEQKRIASVLYSVDEQLRVLHDRHDELSRLKHGLMQDLLTGNTRVTPEYPVMSSVQPEPSDVVDKEWKNVKLPELFDKYQAGGTPKTTNEDYYTDDDLDERAYHFLKIDSITDNKYIEDGNELITEEGLSDSTARLYEEGDLVLSIYGSYGKVGILSTEAAVSQAMLGIVPNSREVNTEFLYYLLNSLDDQYKALASGTTQQNLSKSLISLIDVDVPPLWEQERIASILYTVDEMIARTSDLIDEYERLKRGLMQDLLSGDVRTPEDLEVLDEVTNS